MTPTWYTGGYMAIPKRGGVVVGPWSVADVQCIDIHTTARSAPVHTASNAHTHAHAHTHACMMQ